MSNRGGCREVHVGPDDLRSDLKTLARRSTTPWSISARRDASRRAAR